MTSNRCQSAIKTDCVIDNAVSTFNYKFFICQISCLNKVIDPNQIVLLKPKQLISSLNVQKLILF